jgi:hypothetical protein
MISFKLRPARAANFIGGFAARRLRDAVATVASLPSLLVFVASISEPGGRLTRFTEGDSINAPPDGSTGAESYETLLDAMGGVAVSSGGRRLGAARRRHLALDLVPGAGEAPPADGVSITLNLVVGTPEQAATVSSALQGADGGEVVAPALQALAADQGLPFPGNFSGGVAPGSLKLITVTRKRKLWQRILSFIASLSPTAIYAIVGASLVGCGALSIFLWRRAAKRKRLARVKAERQLLEVAETEAIKEFLKKELEGPPSPSRRRGSGGAASPRRGARSPRPPAQGSDPLIRMESDPGDEVAVTTTAERV